MKVSGRGIFFSKRGIRNWYIFCQNGIQKSKALALRAD